MSVSTNASVLLRWTGQMIKNKQTNKKITEGMMETVFKIKVLAKMVSDMNCLKYVVRFRRFLIRFYRKGDKILPESGKPIAWEPEN